MGEGWTRSCDRGSRGGVEVDVGAEAGGVALGDAEGGAADVAGVDGEGRSCLAMAMGT